MKIPYEWTRDEAIELCLEALATGGVYGVTANHDPDLLTTATSFGQNSDSELSMWRTWSLIEAHFGRWQADMPWRCGFLMVQSWRIHQPPKFSMLRKELHRYGFQFTGPGETRAGSEQRTVIASGSSATIDRDTGKHHGRVLKIGLPAAPPFTEALRRRTSPELRTAVRDLAATAAAPADSWPAWFERLPPGDLLWHLRLLRSLHLHLPESGRRPEWVCSAGGCWSRPGRSGPPMSGRGTGPTSSSTTPAWPHRVRWPASAWPRSR